MADVVLDKFAGLRNTAAPEQLAAADLTVADNIDLDNAGAARRRDGSTLRVPGAAHSLWASGTDCLYVAGDQLRRLHADYSSTLLASGLLAARPLSYVPVAGRIYWSNGVQTGIVDGNRSRSWGLAAPEVPDVAATAGLLPAGRYQAALGWVRRDGQESGVALPAVIDLADGAGVRFAWDRPRDTDIAQAALYLSEPDGMVLYRAAVADVTAGSATVTRATLATPCATQWLDRPPAGQSLAYARGRIYIAQGPTLFATAALGYEYVDLRDFLAFDGSPIRFVAGIDAGVFVGTEQAVYFAAGERLDAMSVRTVVGAPGCAGSVAYADGARATGRAELAGLQVCLFATGDGIVLGLPDGGVLHLTQPRYTFAVAAAAAASFRHDATRSQYLLFQPA